MTTQAIAVQFHDQSLTTAIIDSIPHVAMKPICENIGLQWEGQFQRIKRHPVLSQVMCMTHMTSLGKDGKEYLVEMLMLPLEYLNGWLFGVDTNRVKNGTREKLIQYQKECFKVLANHFMPQPQNHQVPEPPTRTAIAGCLTRDQQDVIKALVKERAEALPKEMQAGATIRCWSAIKKKFGCSYKEVPSDNFVNVISLLSRLPLEGELLAPPAPEQLLSRSEVEAMINERMKAPAIPVKLPHTGQTLGFNIEANLKLDGLIDGLERYGYRIIRIRNDAGLLS